MEKYARQALAEGVKSADDLVVTTDSELYRVLNLHYNRNNQLEVPEGFRIAVQVRALSSLVSSDDVTQQTVRVGVLKCHSYEILSDLDGAQAR